MGKSELSEIDCSKFKHSCVENCYRIRKGFEEGIWFESYGNYKVKTSSKLKKKFFSNFQLLSCSKIVLFTQKGSSKFF